MYFDFDLYTRLFPEETPERAARIIPVLNEAIEKGSKSQEQHEVTVREAAEGAKHRAIFYKWMGWSQSGNMMHTWHKSVWSSRNHDLPPGVVVQGVRFIDALHGHNGDLAEQVHRCRGLLGCKPASLQKDYDHSVRLAGVFGWDEQKVRRIIQQRPDLLETSAKLRFFYARAMADHSEKLKTNADSDAQTALRIRDWPAYHLLGRIAGFGDTQRRKSRKDDLQSNFLLGLNTPRRQCKIGDQVLHAYFRYDPVKNLELLDKYYPNLRQYHPAAIRAWEAKKASQFEGKIEPDAPWLSVAALAGKQIDFEALTNNARLGSIKLTPNAQLTNAIKAKTIEARMAFITELGWFDPKHKMYNYACLLGKNENYVWPTPKRIMDAITVLSKYTDDPLYCMRLSPRGIFDRQPATLEKKLIAITEACAGAEASDIKAFIAQNIAASIATIYKRGKQYREKHGLAAPQ